MFKLTSVKQSTNLWFKIKGAIYAPFLVISVFIPIMAQAIHYFLALRLRVPPILPQG